MSARMRVVVVMCAASIAGTAEAEDAAEGHDHCVWPAIPGAMLGLAAGYGASVGVLSAAGADPFAESPGVIAITLAGESLGMSFGPAVSCGLFSEEPHAVPAATFVIGGALLAGTAVGVPAFLWARDALVLGGGDYVNPAPFLLVVTTAMALGGWGGWELHDLRDAPPAGGAAIAPVIGPRWSGATLALSF